MLTPTQILERMLETLAPFEGAHTEGSIDRAILQVEANRLFRLFRSIEESSGQRFLVTASGEFLDKIGQGMGRARFPQETDEQYRQRLIFSADFWNDSTLNGLKTMIKNYYGIDVDADEYDENRIVELYKQAASFWNTDEEGWIDPSSDFGAEWLGEMNFPAALEVHLKAFQEGEEKWLKKRQLYSKLMSTRAAGVIVFLYFHLDFWGDRLPHPTDRYPEPELINRNTASRPQVKEFFDVTIKHGEVVKIVANAVDKATGKISRRILHDRQKSKCREDFLRDYGNVEEPYLLAEIAEGRLARRPEPFRFRQSRMRNNCWTFFYNKKYEEIDIDTKQKHTFYTRPNPMVDATHHYRGDDVHGMEFFSLIDYMEFWWRVSSTNNGLISVPSIPRKLTVFKIKEGTTKFWWRVVTFDGQELSIPSTANLLEILGSSINPIAPPMINRVDNWSIQTKNVNLQQLSLSARDLIILERYNIDEHKDWTKDEISAIKTSVPPNASQRVVLARLPVGCMSLVDRDISSIMGVLHGPVDGDVVRIRYWLTEWMNILSAFLDKIIDIGFDGVLLDGLNVTESWIKENPNAESMMKLVVKQIANYARHTRAKSFIVIPRGQEQWGEDPEFINLVNGIMGEDIFFVDNEQQSAIVTMNKVNNLSKFKQNGKPVLVIDYPTLPELVQHFIGQSAAVGFIPHSTTRQWDCFIP